MLNSRPHTPFARTSPNPPSTAPLHPARHCSALSCLTPPLGAQAGAQAGEARFCLEAAWNNGVCEAGCNNLECGYNECTTSQIISACVARQELALIDYSVPPVAGQAKSPSSLETGTSVRYVSEEASHTRARGNPPIPHEATLGCGNHV